MNSNYAYYMSEYSNFDDKEVNEETEETTNAGKYTDIGIALIGLGRDWLQNRRDRKSGDYTRQLPPPPPPKKNNTLLYVLGGLAVVGVGVAVYLGTRKN